MAWSDIFLPKSNFHWAGTKVTLTHLAERERESDSMTLGEWTDDLLFRTVKCEEKKKKKKLIMRTDFTFQVAASECHKAGGDEVVHVLASAAHVFLPIVTWWEEEKQEINISVTLRWRDVADLSRFQVSSWVSRVPTNIYKALKCPSVITMTIFYLCPHSICNQTRWFLLKGRRNIL